jgi:hypothetical protein
LIEFTSQLEVLNLSHIPYEKVLFVENELLEKILGSQHGCCQKTIVLTTKNASTLLLLATIILQDALKVVYLIVHLKDNGGQ